MDDYDAHPATPASAISSSIVRSIDRSITVGQVIYLDSPAGGVVPGKAEPCPPGTEYCGLNCAKLVPNAAGSCPPLNPAGYWAAGATGAAAPAAVPPCPATRRSHRAPPPARRAVPIPPPSRRARSPGGIGLSAQTSGAVAPPARFLRLMREAGKRPTSCPRGALPADSTPCATQRSPACCPPKTLWKDVGGIRPDTQPARETHEITIVFCFD